jgi:hypothetical protein
VRKCTGTPAQIIRKVISDARTYNTSKLSYGFSGDPLHAPDPTRNYGYLIRAAAY